MENRNYKIYNLQKDSEKIRNVCIIAHIDHGKTSLTDNLLCSNNIISKNLSGKLRFMDDRADEQEREITMKSSTCSLLAEYDNNEYLLNIVDTPGHIDFSFEVSSALRICEGSILVVDVLEGVLTQTFNVLKKALEFNLKIVWVLNKIDKLFSVLKLKNEEIEELLFTLVENINDILFSLIEQKVNFLLENLNIFPENSLYEVKKNELLEYYNAENYFDPIKNNVIFASSIDNWGFTIGDFSKIYSEKLKIDENALINGLWGYKYLTKSLKITEVAPNINSKTIFNTIILNNLSTVYKALEEKNLAKIENICKVLKININSNSLKLMWKENSSITSKIMQNWLPLHKALFKVLYEHIDNPINSQLLKNEVLLEFGNCNENEICEIENILTEKSESYGLISKVLRINKNSIFSKKLDLKEKYLFFGMSKLISGVLKNSDKISIKYKENEDNSNTYKYITEDIEELYIWQGNNLIAIDEVYAGNVFAFRINNNNFKRATFSSLKEFPNLIIESEEKNLLKINIYPKDNNNYEYLLKSLNILNQVDPVAKIFTDDKGQFILECQGEIHLERCIRDINDNFENIEVEISKPIINFKEQVFKDKLSLMKRKYKNFDKLYEEDFLEKDLEIIEENKEDEEVENIENNKESENEKQKIKKFYSESSFYSDSEEEKKAQQLKDMKLESESIEEKSFNEDSKFNFKESKFIFKEQKDGKKEVNKKYKTMKIDKYDLEKIRRKKNFKEILIQNRNIAVGVQVISMGKIISEWLEKNEKDMKKYFLIKNSKKSDLHNFISKFLSICSDNLDSKLFEIIKRCLVSFGPKKYGNNILVSFLVKKKDNFFSNNNYKVENNIKIEHMLKKFREHYFKNNDLILDYWDYNDILNCIETSFDNYINTGPIFDEPCYGNIVIIEYIREIKNKKLHINSELDIKTQLQNALKNAFKEAFLGGQPRIIQPIYLGTAFVSDINQSSYFEIVKKRRGKIISSEFNQQLNLIITEIHLPIYESYGFYTEVMKNTSGKVVPQLKFLKYEPIDEDPFFEPITKDEIEDIGENFTDKNYAKELLTQIRERKGYLTEKKIIEDANKQSTLSKTK